MSKRLYLLGISVVLVSLLAGGLTYALFTAQATNSATIFTAGTVKLDSVRDQGDTVPGPMFYTTPEQGATVLGESGIYPTGLWKPGDSHSRQLDVFNKGSLAAQLTKIRADVDPVSDIQPGSIAYAEFTNKMNIKVQMSGSSKVLYEGPLAGLVNGWYEIHSEDIVPIAAYTNPLYPPCAHLTFTATLDLAAGNAVQGINPVFGFTVLAEQQANNP